MDYQFSPEHRTRGLVVTLVMAALFGLPCFLFVNVITAGALLLPLVAFGVFGLYALPHYLLWGRRSSRSAGARWTGPDAGAPADGGPRT